MPEQRYIREAAVRGELPGAEASHCCAYNQTRERFLCADVEAGDFPAANLDSRLAALTPGAGSALWIHPFRGISPTSVRVPIDLVYLDRSCVVLDAIESFPLSSVSSSSAPAASVLALPANAIASTGTQPGDQLFLCPPEEMKRRLQQLLSARTEAQPEPTTASAQELASRTTVGRVLPWVDRSRPKPGGEDPCIVEVSPLAAPHSPAPEPEPEPEPDQALSPAPAPEVTDPAPKPKASKSWLQRLLSPEPPQPRQATRESLEGLSAYFFTGGDPVAHAVRNISPTGFYVLTEERWYPGTIIRMTLTDRRQPTASRSITVNASVVRWGSDGVGLQFILHDGRDQRRGRNASVDGMTAGATKAQIEQFIARLRSIPS
jgi:hypothetical protein